MSRYCASILLYRIFIKILYSFLIPAGGLVALPPSYKLDFISPTSFGEEFCRVDTRSICDIQYCSLDSCRFFCGRRNTLGNHILVPFRDRGSTPMNVFKMLKTKLSFVAHGTGKLNIVFCYITFNIMANFLQWDTEVCEDRTLWIDRYNFGASYS
jgi:hypothetical protein